MKSCVDLYCKLAGVKKESLPPATTPFVEDDGKDLGLGCEPDQDSTAVPNNIHYLAFKNTLKDFMCTGENAHHIHIPQNKP